MTPPKLRLEMGIDFLSFTLHNGGLPLAFKTLRNPPENLQPRDKGLYGYKFSFVCPGVTVLYSPDRPEVHIQLTSLACRYYGSKLTEMVPPDAVVTRCDLRCDVFNGLLSVDEIWGLLRQGNYVSTFRSIVSITRIESDEYAGGTVYLGAPSSDVRLRIYDKGHEQKTTKNPLQWVRYEFQFRGDASRCVFAGITETNEAEQFLGLLHKTIRLTTETRIGKEHNANRLPTLEKWFDTFACRIKKVFYRPYAKSPRFDSMMNYIRNAGSMLNVIRKARPDFEDMLHHFADIKEGKLKDHHLQLLTELTNPAFASV